MKRSLFSIVSGILLGIWFSALPAQAQPDPTPPAITATDAAATSTFEIRGKDRRLGRYEGTLRLTERSARRTDAVLDIRYQHTNRRRILSGTLALRRGRLKGVLRSTRGIAGRLARRGQRGSLYASIKVRPDNAVTGSLVGGGSGGGFRGSLDQPSVPDAPGHPADQLTGEHFAGKPIVDFNPDVGVLDPKGVAYRIKVDWDTEDQYEVKLKKLLDDPRASQVETVILGYWSGDAGPDKHIKTLADNKDKLPALKNLFVGDIDQEEAEISWIMQGDLSPLLKAYSKLELLKVRGGNDLSFGSTPKHKNLKTLIVESGGLSRTIPQQIGSGSFPALEHLELWLGSDEYGWHGDATAVDGILSGQGLPKLKFLGLMDSVIQDDIAKAAATAPIVAQLKTLDLSMGTLSDEGAKALLAAPALKKLRLNLRHHYMSDAVSARFAAEGFNANVADKQDDWDPDDDYRYVEVSE